MSLIKNLQALEKQYPALEPSEEVRNQLNQQVIGFSNNFLNDIEDMSAFINPAR
ncbi:hypothetical protein MNBD_GAMMA02-1159 [hydrothermal vent metagenome]|uniref:Uncharacterized protein n=1 Tax=hydrothermal vent metagenome TaxID=652676 RepID=A0A3B0W632_9ZZZZ